MVRLEITNADADALLDAIFNKKLPDRVKTKILSQIKDQIAPDIKSTLNVYGENLTWRDSAGQELDFDNINVNAAYRLKNKTGHVVAHFYPVNGKFTWKVFGAEEDNTIFTIISSTENNVLQAIHCANNFIEKVKSASFKKMCLGAEDLLDESISSFTYEGTFVRWLNENFEHVDCNKDNTINLRCRDSLGPVIAGISRTEGVVDDEFGFAVYGLSQESNLVTIYSGSCNTLKEAVAKVNQVLQNRKQLFKTGQIEQIARKMGS